MARGSLSRHRDFRSLWLGDTISQFGTLITQTSAPLLAALVLSATPFQMGLLTASSNAAFLLVGLPAGAWVDRMRRRPVMYTADLVRAALLFSVPLAWWFGVLTLVQLIAVTLLVGVLTVFFDLSYQSYLPTLVGREHLIEGNGKLQASQSVAQVSGPALGGLLTQAFGAANALLANAVGYLVSAVCLWRIRTVEPEPVRPPERNMRREIAEGLRFVLHNRSLVAVVATTGGGNLFFSMCGAVEILFLTRQLGASPGLVGALTAVGGIGGVLGAVSAGMISDRIGQARTIWLSLLVTTPFMLLTPLAQRGPLIVLFAVGYLFCSFGVIVYNIAQVSYRQAICPDRLLGRMNASVRFIVWGVSPIGALIGGGLGGLIGVRATLAIGALGMSLTALPVLFSPLRKLRDLPTTVVDTEPDTEPEQGDPLAVT